MTTDTKYQAAHRLMLMLSEGGYPTRLVGGCVRDRVLGLKPKDYDLATTALPHEVAAVCRAQGLKTVPTGIEFGTITVLIEKMPFEVTTLRTDIKTDGRHAEVKFGGSFEEDAARRDFTMNAMSEEGDGTIYDYFGGRQHLQEQLLVFVGDASQRIREDYLRIMRFFRFKARFALHTTPATFSAISREQFGLVRVSKERITQELWQILSSTKIATTFHELNDTGVFATLFPPMLQWASQAKDGLISPKHDSMQDKLDKLGDLYRASGRFGLWLLLAKPKDPLNMLDTSLKLSNAERTRLLFCANGLDLLRKADAKEQASAFGLIDACEQAGGVGSFFGLFVPLWSAYLDSDEVSVKLQEIAELEKHKSQVRKKPMPVNGKDVMEWTGLPPGPDLGRVLEALTRSFRNEQWRTRDEAKQWVAKHQSC